MSETVWVWDNGKWWKAQLNTDKFIDEDRLEVDPPIIGSVWSRREFLKVGDHYCVLPL